MQINKPILFTKRHGGCLSTMLGSVSLLLAVSSTASAATPVWAATYSSGTNIDVPVAVRTDNLGNTYVAGYTQFPDFSRIARTAKFDSTGALVWVQTYTAAGFSDKGQAVAVDSA